MTAKTMTVDIRAAAEREANRLRVTSHGREYGMSRPYKDGFTDGAVWAQAQLTPTREQVKAAATKAWDEWWANDSGKSFQDALADAVLALLQEQAQ